MQHGRFSVKKVFLKILKISQENTVLESLFNKVAGFQACDFIKKETPTQLSSCEIRKIFEKTYFEEHLRTTASGSRFFLYEASKEKEINEFQKHKSNQVNRITAVNGVKIGNNTLALEILYSSL